MKNVKMYSIGAAFVIVIGLAAGIFIRGDNDTGLVGNVHEHADIKVYLDGEELNFSQEKYMSSEDQRISNFVHMHDLNGNVIHKHAKDISLDFFLESLNIRFNSTCFVVDETEYCNTENKKIKLFVNGKENDKFEKYELKDLDQILISYGTQQTIINQLESLTGEACIYSELCPEKGSPPPEATCISDGCLAEGSQNG